MDTPSSEINPLDSLAEEFVERHRRGEKPTLDEYTAKHPQLAAEIRDLFPALVMMEEVRPDKGDATGDFSGVTADGKRAEGKKLERLGDYRILREVGRGGMGIVYEAEQESLGRHVALKVLPAHALLDPQRLRRFTREAKAAARLHHTNIVPVYGVGDADGLHYYVMQFIQGLGLDQVLAELRKLRRSKTAATAPAEPSSRILRAADVSAVDVARSLLTGRFTAAGPVIVPEDGDAAAPTLPLSEPSPARASDSSSTIHLPGQSEHSSLSEGGRQFWQSVARIGVQVAEALAYANAQGTLHRDIKPSNLLLDTQGTVWVADFGLAKAADSEDLTHAGDIVGTIRYMAPERFRSQGDARSDIYSLGLTLYELLTLRPAFEESDKNNLISIVAHDTPAPPRNLNPNVPRDLETVVLKAIARDPGHRYQSAVEMAADLRRYLEDKPIRARRVSAVEKTWRWCRRNPALAGLTATVLALLFAGAVGGGVAAYHFRKMANEAKRLEGEALDAKKDAEDLAQKIIDDLENLKQANSLTDSARLKSDDGHWDESLTDYTAAVEHRPDLAFVWINRGALYLQFYQWEEAADDFAKGFDLQPPVDPSLWHNHAALRLYVGDTEGYRLVCRQMLKRFEKTADPKTAELLARTCCLGPNSVEDWTPVVQLVDKIAADNPDNVQYFEDLIGVLQRSGQAQEAVIRYDAWLKRKNANGVDVDTFGNLLIILALQQFGNDKGRADAEQRLETVASTWNTGSLAVTPTYGQDAGPYSYTLQGYPQGSYNPQVAGFGGGQPNWPYDPDAFVLRRECQKKLEIPAKPEETTLHWLARMRGRAVLHQWEKAAAAAEQAIASAPDDYTLRLERGRILVWGKKWNEAAADLDQAIGMHRDDAAAWFERGRMFALQERWAEAARDFHEAIDKPENSLVVPALEGGQGQLDVRTEILRWEPVFTELTRLRPADGELWMARGRNFSQKGKTADALAAFTKAIQVQPDNIQFYWERGALHAEESQWDAAAADYVKIFDLVGDKADPANWKAIAWNAINANEQILAKAVELRPDYVEVVLYRANGHAGRNEAEPALRDYARVLDKAPDRNEVRLYRGRLYVRLRRWEDAAADFTKGLGEGALNDDWFQLAALHLLTGHTKEYEEHCRKTIQLHDTPVIKRGVLPGGGFGGPGAGPPDESDFHAGRILSLGPAEKEVRKQGAQWAERAVTVAPNHPSYLHSLALAHYRAGRYAQAIERLKESRKTAGVPGTPGAGQLPDWGGPLNPLLLAMCYQALDQPEDAYAERYLAEDWATRTNKDRPPAEANMPPPGLTLADWLEYQVLKREAERVFGAGKP